MRLLALQETGSGGSRTGSVAGHQLGRYKSEVACRELGEELAGGGWFFGRGWSSERSLSPCRQHGPVEQPCSVLLGVNRARLALVRVSVLSGKVHCAPHLP